MQDTSSALPHKKRIFWISVTASLVGIASFVVLLFNTPLNPWVAGLKSCIYLSPVLAAYLYAVYRYAHKWTAPLQHTYPTNKRRSLITTVLGCGCILWLATVFTYNRMADTSPTTYANEKILLVDYTSGKHSRNYYVEVHNPNPPLLPFFDTPTTHISIRESDVTHITPHQTSIRFPIHQGALGLPWTQHHTYDVLKPLDAFGERLTSHTTMPALTPQHTVPFSEISAACRWSKQAYMVNDIEPITPTSYARDFWLNGALRSVIPMVGDEKHGIEHDTFDNGQVYGDIPWKHNKKHGVFTLHRPDGSTEQRLSYKDGAPYGINQWFDSNGQMTYSYLYINEKVILPARMCRGM
jgi:hypothetical protein